MPQMVLVVCQKTHQILYANAHYLKIMKETEVLFPGISKYAKDLIDAHIFKEISFEFPCDDNPEV
jgi:hypothetical protein